MITGSKLSLPNVCVYAFCWGEEHVRKCLKTMAIAMDQINFGEAIMITNSKKTDLSKFNQDFEENNIKVCDFGTDIDLDSGLKNDNNRGNFSKTFLETSDKYISTEFCLNVQHDSTVIDIEKWDNAFFDYDYIGAPWPLEILRSSDMCTHSMVYFPNIVGNGGFSLRSKKFIKSTYGLETFHKNEDLNVCVFNYEIMKNRGVKFAPPELAFKFSVEHPIQGLKVFNREDLSTYKSFGFHGEFNKAGMDFINKE